MINFCRVTVWYEGHEIASQLGLIPDQNSRSDCAEWYYTFENMKDLQALVYFFCLPVDDPTQWVAHSVSFWPCDPRLR